MPKIRYKRTVKWVCQKCGIEVEGSSMPSMLHCPSGGSHKWLPIKQ